MTSQEALLDSSLVAWQDARGARRGTLAGGGDAVMEYGDARGEYEALREGCGLIDLAWCDRLIVAGADRQRFLNAYLTCDVKDLTAGGGAYGFFTSAQGRILADAVVAALDDQALILLPPARGAAIREHLARFVLADRVELRSPVAMTALALVGPSADEVLSAAGAPAPAAQWASARWFASGGETVIQRLRSCGETAYLILAAIEEAAAVATRLVGCGARPVGSSAVEVLRVESGVPRFGVDYDERHFPQETGLEDAVSFTKGCYLGQEVVARIHYRGHVNRTLCGVVFERDQGAIETARPHEPLLFTGEEVGKLGTVVVSPRLGRTIGLAVLHGKAATPGTALVTASDLAVAVAPLPFVE